MSEDRVDRRLAAIMAGDIAGYSRLMGADEEGTLRQLKGHRKELVDPKITEHRGRIEFRFGINVGDIIIDGDDIFGDGVNIAARLEALADPGGIMVSGIVHDQVRDKLSFDFDDMGQQTVKNITRPVGVHRVQLAEHSPRRQSSATVGKLDSAVSDRPSIAVLPFANTSGDPEQEYFADGISEDIITGLSKLR